MRIIINHKIIRRNKRIGQITTIGSLAILAIGFIISLQTNISSSDYIYSLLALIVGFILSQVGIYFGNRWGRTPRPDEVLAAGLKGLEDKYTLYSYTTVVPHVLIGPAGIWILSTYTQQGLIMYDPVKKKWNQKGGNFLLKIFGQESLGRPDQDTYSLLQDFQKFTTKELDIPNLPPPQVAMVFLTDPKKVSIAAPDSPIPIMNIDKLKDFIRRQAKENAIRSEAKDPQFLDSIIQLRQILPQESIE
jgi:hypothetical protein